MRLLKILFSTPRSVWFNFRYLPFRQAFKLPVWLACNVRVKRMYRGGIVLNKPYRGQVRIGYHEADAVDTFSSHTILRVERGGKIVFADDGHIGHGALLHVKPNATLSLGKNFAISGTTKIICTNSIEMGDDVQFSWDSLVMDSNAHTIYNCDGNELEKTGTICLGNRIWIGANTTLLKGTRIADDSVVASNSLVNKAFSDQKVLIGGIPAKIIKQIGGWHI